MASLDQLHSRQSEIKARLAEIDNEYEGEALPDQARAEWNKLNEEQESNGKLIGELEARAARLEELSTSPANREEPAAFNTRRNRVEDIYDLSQYRGLGGPEAERLGLIDGAKRSIEQATFPHPRAEREEIQGHLENLVEVLDGEGRDGESESLARRILATGSPTYKRAFGKKLVDPNSELTSEERTALSTTAANGGYAVPYTLDPTIIPTSNSSVNPYRSISRVERITTTTWQGVSSAGITAAFAAQATEASDNSPTLAQPTVTPARAQAFIPYSIEIGQDWGALQNEMAMLIQDAKDDLEADRFTFGTASTPEPEGIIKGGTAFTNTAATATFAIADVYSLEQALPPRFRPRASFVGNRAVYNKIRQFDTAGGAGLWVDNLRQGLANQVPTPGNLNQRLLDYGTNECSAMSTATTTSSTDILVFGDFNYFVIVDRIGLNIEFIPHLFGASNRYPTGQRGIYAYWRTGSVVASVNAFRKLRVL